VTFALTGTLSAPKRRGGCSQQGQYRDRTDEIRRRGGKLLKERQIVAWSIARFKGEMAGSRSKLES